MSDVVIQVDGLAKRFDGILTVDNLTLNVGQAEVLAFLGPNAAGKTSTVRLLAPAREYADDHAHEGRTKLIEITVTGH